jgi:hypothetical protein
MSSEMNETFMIQTSTPEVSNDDNEFPIDNIQTKLTQVHLKTTLSDEQNQHHQTQKHQTPPIELVILPKTQDDIVVKIIFLFPINFDYF